MFHVLVFSARPISDNIYRNSFPTSTDLELISHLHAATSEMRVKPRPDPPLMYTCKKCRCIIFLRNFVQVTFGHQCPMATHAGIYQSASENHLKSRGKDGLTAGWFPSDLSTDETNSHIQQDHLSPHYHGHCGLPSN